MPPPSSRCTSWKWIDRSSSAPKTLIGTVTAPNAMAPFQIERGMGAHYPDSSRGPLWPRSVRRILLVMNLDRSLIAVAVLLFAAGLIAGGGPVTAVGLLAGMGLVLVAAWRHGRRGGGAWSDAGAATLFVDGDPGGGHHGAGHHGHGGDFGGGHFGGGHH